MITESQKITGLMHKLHPLLPSQKLLRLGPKGDGGYLVPDDLDGIAACFSPGVDLISGFEKDCANLGMDIFLADNSVDGPAEQHDKFVFTKKNIGAVTSEHFMTMDDWVISSLPDSNADLILQIDIEGYEYEVFLSMSPNLLQRFRIIVVEFHNLDMLWSRPFFSLADSVFEKILQNHSCVHIHPNNCVFVLNHNGLVIPPVMEYTFLRKDRFTQSPTFAKEFPHPLDYNNCLGSTVPLPRCWYR